MAGLLDRALLISKTAPADQLAEIRARIGDAEAEIIRLDGEISRRAMAIVGGDQQAFEVCVGLEREKREIGDELATLRQAEADPAAVVSAAEGAARQAASRAAGIEEAQAKARDRQEYIAGVVEIRIAAERLAFLIKSHEPRVAAIAARGGGNAFRFTAVVGRLRSALTHVFAYGDGAQTSGNNLFGMVADVIGADYWREPEYFETQLLGDLLPFFTDAAEADAARVRLAVRGRMVDVIEDPAGVVSPGRRP